MLKKFLFSLFGLLFVSNTCFAFTFHECSRFQEQQIIIATKQADFFAENVIKEKDQSYFIKWMGYNEISDIKKSFQYMKNVLDAEYIDFYCGCSEKNYCSCSKTTYAAASSTIDYKITICQRFWEVSLTGIDSRAGTLIHELSHFKSLVGTHDIFSYRDECLKAARPILHGDQNLTIQNANNYEYLAEDINN